ncbi:MAG TPA: hypothetical protein VGN43_04740 [Steroidobacteraceae bacterium]|nr:hypothetical protein [Steroidobacteraceae bacterium]
MRVRPDGKYVLHSPVGERVIAAQRWRVQTASPLFDALFAMAQEDLSKDSVNVITDAAFDHGRPIPCRCFIAGKKWPFVWTRDVSYSVDLGLWRLDPARARASLLFKMSPPRAGPAPAPRRRGCTSCRTQAPEAVGRSALIAWSGSWARVICWRIARLPTLPIGR